MRNVSEWAQVRTLVADGVSQREIAARLGMNRRTVRRLAGAAEPPRYRRQPSGSMLDPLDSVLRKLVADFEGIRAPRVTELLRDDYGYGGSVDLVRRRLAELRPKAGRPAQKTGYREIAARSSGLSRAETSSACSTASRPKSGLRWGWSPEPRQAASRIPAGVRAAPTRTATASNRPPRRSWRELLPRSMRAASASLSSIALACA